MFVHFGLGPLECYIINSSFGHGPGILYYIFVILSWTWNELYIHHSETATDTENPFIFIQAISPIRVYVYCAVTPTLFHFARKGGGGGTMQGRIGLDGAVSP